MNKAGTQRIETDRLILRRFVADDASEMYQNWASDPEVTRFLTWPTHTGVDVSRSVVNNWISRYDDGAFFNWAIVWKENGSVIGNISVVHLNEDIGEAEIGYCMSRDLWGRGIMPEALIAVERYLFETVGVDRISARHDTNNPKSGRVMEKAGMKQEGSMRRAGKNNQGICDVILYAILRNDWVQK